MNDKVNELTVQRGGGHNTGQSHGNKAREQIKGWNIKTDDGKLRERPQAVNEEDTHQDFLRQHCRRVHISMSLQQDSMQVECYNDWVYDRRGCVRWVAQPSGDFGVGILFRSEHIHLLIRVTRAE